MKRSAWGSRGRSGSIRGSGLSGGSRCRTVLDAGEVARPPARPEPWPDSSSGYGNCRGRRAKAAAERRSAATWGSSGSSSRSAGTEEKVASWIDEAAARDEALVVQEHRQVWQGVVRLFDQLEAVLGQGDGDARGDGGDRGSGPEASPDRAGAARIDQVLVGSVERSRQPDLRAVIILGANEGLFPKAPDESALFLDDERALLEAAGVPLGPGSTARLWREQYLVYIALHPGQRTAGDRLQPGRRAGPAQEAFVLRGKGAPLAA